jgi:hypothetical protein
VISKAPAFENSRRKREQQQALLRGLLAAGLLAAALFAGSRNLRHIDAALVGYTFACLFAAFGLGYRYSMWLQNRPNRPIDYAGSRPSPSGSSAPSSRMKARFIVTCH